METKNRQLVLVSRPEGMIDAATTSLVEHVLPEIREGEALVRVRYLSIDPTIRTWMGATPTYRPPIEIGSVVNSFGVGEVVASRSTRYEVGALVMGLTGWQDFCVADEGLNAMAELPARVEVPVAMNVLGITGVTAYIGLLEVGAMTEGDVVVVSGAAGATGSMVGQIARLRGASKVIGIAGGPEKCALLTDRYGFDGAIDYKLGDVAGALREVCPDGIDLFFDNVGGEILDAGLANLALFGRIVVCGAISEYNATAPPRGLVNYPALIIKRGRMQGFIVSDHLASWGSAREEITGWLLEGRLHHAEQIVDGLEHAPEALNLLFTGANTGKVLVRVS